MAASLPERLELRARGSALDALVFSDGRASFAGLAEEARAAAGRLHAAGIGPGDRVGLLLPASVESYALMLGSMRLGAIPVPVNARFKTRELGYVVRHSGMKLLVAEPSYFVFDGYNLMHAAGSSSRDDLVDRLAGYVALRGARGVVVFDGVGEERTVGPLEVRFAVHADELIERLVAEHRVSERVAVVSSDAAIRETAGPMVERLPSRSFLRDRNVTLISAGLDEVPMAYKDIDEVMAAQRDLVEPLARFEPRLVKMAPSGERPED